MTARLISDLERLLQAGTPGPWTWDDDGEMFRTNAGDAVALASPVGHTNSAIVIDRSDADLIVAAVNSLPALLRVVKAAQALRDVSSARGQASVPASEHKRAKLELLAAVDALDKEQAE